MFTLELNKSGAEALIKPYQIKALQVIIENNPKYTETLEIWQKVLQRLDNGTISRPSIINYMNALKDNGYVETIPTTGKGGNRFAYRISDPKKFLDKLATDLNMATSETIDELTMLLTKED